MIYAHTEYAPRKEKTMWYEVWDADDNFIGEYDNEDDAHDKVFYADGEYIIMYDENEDATYPCVCSECQP